MSYGKLRNLVKSLSSSINTLESGTGNVGGYPGPGVVMLVGETENTIYNNITAALASAVAGDTVLLGAGEYNETFTIPAGVIVKGTPAPRDVLLVGSSSTGNIVTLGNGSTLREVRMTTPSGNYPAVRYSGSASSFAICLDLFLVGGGASGTAFRNHGSGQLLCRDINYAAGTLGTLFQNDSGITVLQDGNHLNGTINQTFVLNGGSIDANSWNVLTGSILGTCVAMSGSNSSFFGSSVLTKNYSNIGVHILADSCSFKVEGSEFEGSLYDVLIDSAVTGVGSTFHADGTGMRYERLSFPSTYPQNADIFVLMHDNGVQNDKAYRIITEFSVGSSDIPQESAFGEGDSSVYEMYVFSSGTSGWTDNSEAAKSVSDSTFGWFGGTTSGSVAYVGNSYRKFNGIKADINTAMVGARGRWEYWNGTAWTEFDIMSTKASAPYHSRNEIAFNLVESQQIRFGPITGSWQITTVNGQSGYWVRNRLSGSISTNPVLERIKLGTNRTEINSDGIIEFFGTAEPLKDLIWHKNLEDDLNGSSPSDASITFSSNIAITPVDNRFTANALDGNGGILEIPDGLDTSRNIFFEVLWRAAANGSPSSVELELTTAEVKVGDTIGSLPETAYSKIETVGTADQNVVKKTTFVVNAPTLNPQDLIAFRYFRDGQVGNLDDDFGDNIDIIKTTWKGYFWK